MELGCDAKGFSHAGNNTVTWYCVILAGRPSLELNKMREIMRKAQRALSGNNDLDGTESTLVPTPVAAVALKENRLTFAWLDGEAQKMSDKSTRPSKKGMLTRWFSKSVEKRSGESSQQAPEEYIQQGTDRALAIASSSCEYSPRLTDEQLASIHIPPELEGERYQRDRDYHQAMSRYNAIADEIQALLQAAHETIDASLAEGVDLSQFQKKPKTRGAASFYTKVDRQRRVILGWDASGHPVSPAIWAIKFNEAIGCLVRMKETWNVAFTFNSNPYEAFKNTWIALLSYFVLEDNIDLRWRYVRATMHEKFRGYRKNLKKKYLRDPFQEDWQRIYGLPSTIAEDSFAFLLIHWRSEEARDEAKRNSANRLRNEDPYYGGSVSIPTWRTNVDAAGGDASLATSWEVFHTNEKMPEEQMERHKKHLERFHAGEQAFRESHPDYPPERTILPVAVESTILEHAFPNAAAKGRLPLYGGSSKLNRSDISRSRTAAAHGYYFSPEAQEIRDLHAELASTKQNFEERMQAQVDKQEERERAMREELLTQMRSEMSQYAPPYAQLPTQTSYYQPAPAPAAPPMNLQDYEQFQKFLEWQRMNSGSGGSN